MTEADLNSPASPGGDPRVAPAGDVPATPAGRAPVPAPSDLLRRLGDRILGVSAVADARSELGRRSQRQGSDLALALATRHAAERILYPADPAPHAPHAPNVSPVMVALGLYRDAAFWALSALLPDPVPTEAGEALGRAPDGLVAGLVRTPEQVELLRAAFTGRSVDWARRPVADQRAAVVLLDAFGSAVLAEALRPHAKLRAVVVRRICLGVAALVLVVGGAVTVSAALERPSLTAGKPWRASSSLVECHPREHLCDTKRTDIFFHTLEEESPWVEFDLQEPKAFRKVVVANRTDCCPDRAVPLLLEVSDDQKNWRQVAEQKETFGRWTVQVPRQHARYVRLRSPRRTLLHLEAVDVYP